LEEDVWRGKILEVIWLDYERAVRENSVNKSFEENGHE
jgi:hypothetical protein